MSQSNSPEREFEKLSKAITEAVMSSAKVRKIVTEIQKKDEVCAQSFMVLVLRLSTLTESLEPEDSEAVAQGEAEAAGMHRHDPHTGRSDHPHAPSDARLTWGGERGKRGVGEAGLLPQFGCAARNSSHLKAVIRGNAAAGGNSL